MKEKVTIAYRCPVCGVAMIGEISLFALSGGETNLRCSCGESVMSVNYIKSRDTVSLNVPCVACPTSHPYQVSGSTFFNNDIFILQCSSSGLDVCFIGDKAKVIKAVDDNTAELQKLMEILDERDLDEEDFDIFHNFEKDSHSHDCDCDDCHHHDDGETAEYFDPLVISQMTFIIKELYETGKIKCDCEEGDYMIDVGYDSIEVSCDKCQARKILRAKTDSDIIELAGVDELDLK
ncbi:MAG: hypothetical protein E7582_01310 [Ruminococcaceae bacterium]|nr:hypothetical protein [Oscillospiraceae bacterium]